MHRSLPWIRRGLLVMAAALTIALLTRRQVSADDGILPSIGGDTWPPVPVKKTRTI